jgi:hypothetical protein
VSKILEQYEEYVETMGNSVYGKKDPIRALEGFEESKQDEVAELAEHFTKSFRELILTPEDYLSPEVQLKQLTQVLLLGGVWLSQHHAARLPRPEKLKG